MLTTTSRIGIGRYPCIHRDIGLEYYPYVLGVPYPGTTALWIASTSRAKLRICRYALGSTPTYTLSLTLLMSQPSVDTSVTMGKPILPALHLYRTACTYALRRSARLA